MGRGSKMPDVPPTMQPHRAIPLLRQQIERLDEICKLNYDDPRVDAWLSTTGNILDAVYGRPAGQDHQNTGEFRYAALDLQLHPRATRTERQDRHLRACAVRKALLAAYVEQLAILAPPAAATAADQYRFHAEIERVSGQLYRDGHYKQAALEAYIRVIEEVRSRSGLALDGDGLMNHAFGCDNRTPIIQFNSLQTESERDEQKGFMFLFKGIVSLRNSKAHSNRLFDDPYRAHDYLALASVLMRVLEIATVNRTP